MNKRKLLKDLEQIINDNLEYVTIPYKKGNSIRIGKMVIRQNKYAYLVFDIEKKEKIAETFCKTAAIALAKKHNEGDTTCQNDILRHDHTIEKWYNDSLFYKHTMNTTKDDLRYEIAETRYEIASSHTRQAKSALDRYIFG